MTLELSPTLLLISAGIIAALSAGLGLVLGLWWGERGRRKDVAWWAGVRGAPRDADLLADVDRSTGLAAAEEAAQRRAELHDIMEGLREQARAEGVSASEEELEKEAMRMMGHVYGAGEA